MDVEGAHRRDRQQRRRNYLAVGNHHVQIGGRLAHSIDGRFFADALGLKERQVKFYGGELHG
ncbi:MAG: hypothetical protein PVSMB9_00220 [Candidatus Dormibacteria bacterium]